MRIAGVALPLPSSSTSAAAASSTATSIASSSLLLLFLLISIFDFFTFRTPLIVFQRDLLSLMTCAWATLIPLTPTNVGSFFRSSFPSGSANFKRGMTEAAVSHVWSLTERKPDASLFPDGVTVHHEPIEDFGVPSEAYLDRVVGEIAAVLANNQSALVHCQGGMGRTGTVMACVFAKIEHVSGAEAIASLRKHFRACETKEQIDIVSKWVNSQSQVQDASANEEEKGGEQDSD